jgi:hypothetical protein
MELADHTTCLLKSVALFLLILFPLCYIRDLLLFARAILMDKYRISDHPAPVRSLNAGVNGSLLHIISISACK